VGYQVRLEAAKSDDTRLLFCTLGILLRQLGADACLSALTHVVVDEVHERSLDVDLLLALLRCIPPLRASAGLAPLKVVLMSATADANLLSAYFGGCPILTAEGRTFPVSCVYLEDVYELTGYLLPPDSPAALRAPKQKQKAGAKAALPRGDAKEAKLLRDGWGDDEKAPTNDRFDAALYSGYSQRTRASLGRVDESVIDYEVIECLLAHLHESSPPGGVLVFLPGIREVETLVGRLTSSRAFATDKACVLPLHSSLSSADQRRVFAPARPRGARKVVVATNIAETSVTLEEVVYVVDCGRQKSRQYRRGVSSLEEEWVSAASAKQRQGRAGRVRPGIYFGLYTRQRAESFRCVPAFFQIFSDFFRFFLFSPPLRSATQQAEIQRIPLAEAALHFAAIAAPPPHSAPFSNPSAQPAQSAAASSAIQRLFALTPEPPSSDAVARALAHLRDASALDEFERLTPLGTHLARLPCDLAAGKLLLLGTLLRVTRHALTLVAALSGSKPIFAPSPDERDASERIRRSFSDSAASGIAAGQASDHLVTVDAFEGLREAGATGGARGAAEYCRAMRLCPIALASLSETRKQLARALAECGFFSCSPSEAFSVADSLSSPWNTFCGRPAVLRDCALCAALSPQIALGSLVDTVGGMGGKSVWAHAALGAVVLHPSSILQSQSQLARTVPALLFQSANRTTQLYVRDLSAVSPAGLLLFSGGEVEIQHAAGRVSLPCGLKISADAQTAVLLKALRAAVWAEIRVRLVTPEAPVSEGLMAAVAAVLRDCSA
jgi:ATP-dependent RNA helicase DHX29